MEIMGVTDLLGASGAGLEDVLSLAEVAEEYLIASEDGNEALKALKLKQYKEMYVKTIVGTDVYEEEISLMTKRERNQYDQEIDQAATVTLELIETYMRSLEKILDGDVDSLDINDLSTLVSRLEQLQNNDLDEFIEVLHEGGSKTYDEWLQYYGQ